MSLERRRKDEKETTKDEKTISLADLLDLQIEKISEDSEGKKKEFEREIKKDKNINISGVQND